MSAWTVAGAPDLGFPEPPPDLRPLVRHLEPNRWGTVDDQPALTGLGWFANVFDEGAEEGLREPYLLAGIERTAGVDALHYALAYGDFGLFVQTPLGDPDGAMAAASRVQEKALRLMAGGDLAGRLTVLWLHYSDRWWHFRSEEGFVDEGFGGPIGAEHWLADR